MGLGKRDEENPVSEDEAEAEKQKLRPEASVEMEMKKLPLRVKDANYPEVIPGHSEPLLKVHHLKYLLLGFNCFITTLGLVMLCVAIWVRVDPEFWEYQSTLDVDNLKTVCVLFMVAAIIILIIGFLGCFGAVAEKRWLLILYILIFGLVFVIQLAALVLMWYAPYSSTIKVELEKQILTQIKERNTDDSSRYFVDFIQEHLECCGSISPRDYVPGDLTPNSCQRSDTGNIHEIGCATKMLSYIRKKAGIFGGIALPILLVQLLALFAAGCLIRSLKMESGYEM
ncbi:Tetraspanin-6, partial [Stegodyphus mimosarum]